jgi:hypothetical protein
LIEGIEIGGDGDRRQANVGDSDERQPYREDGHGREPDQWETYGRMRFPVLVAGDGRCGRRRTLPAVAAAVVIVLAIAITVSVAVVFMVVVAVVPLRGALGRTHAGGGGPRCCPSGRRKGSPVDQQIGFIVDFEDPEAFVHIREADEALVIYVGVPLDEDLAAGRISGTLLGDRGGVDR